MIKTPKSLDYTERLNTSIRPQDDFFSHVNSNWLAAHPIPDSETRWGVFTMLRDTTWRQMKELYESLENATLPVDSVERQAQDFYHSGLHFDDYAATHLAEVQAVFAKIDEAQTPQQLSEIMGELQTMGVDGPWGMAIEPDDHDSSRHLLRLHQSGLTLPEREYYLDDSSRMREIRHQYKAFCRQMCQQLPQLSADPEQFWQAVYSLEHDLAEISRPSEDLRELEENYHSMSFAELAAAYPTIDWPAYAQAAGWRPAATLSVDQPEFLQCVNDQLASRPAADWQAYLKWQFTTTYASKISSQFAEAHFGFFGRILGGAKEIMPLWKRVVLTIDGGMGEAVGRLYVRRHFPESSKQKVLGMVEDVRSAYAERIEQLDWMSQPTKALALQKLANMKVLIGFPDSWRDFSGLAVVRDSYLGNVLAAEKFETAYWLSRLQQPTSREDWLMSPQTINAYNDSSRLVICFPAAILQPPFFDPAAPDAVNMGGIGTVIGHEFTHGFDDKGCEFDALGNRHTWQTAAEQQALASKANIIIDQANKFEVLPGLCLKGKLVIGESIADLGGIEIALHALRAAMGTRFDQVTDEGMTPTQLFFINYATAEGENVREEKLREYTLSDPHPAGRFRVNGVLAHVDSFYEAFSLQPDDKLYRPSSLRARIW
jgi:putative endopeptidase